MSSLLNLSALAVFTFSLSLHGVAAQVVQEETPIQIARIAPAQGSGLFGSHETMSRQLVAFKKWNGMLERSKQDLDHIIPEKRPCRLTEDQQCYMDSWRSFLTFLKGKSAQRQIAEINVYMNKSPYITDIINWGVPDYWTTVRQFFNKDGDCEDYAIAKYMSLKSLGFDAEKMRVVVVHDTNLDIPHAVLVVSIGGERLILDNQISYVVKEKAVLHYRPYYSINETAWWLHRM